MIFGEVVSLGNYCLNNLELEERLSEFPHSAATNQLAALGARKMRTKICP